MGDGSARLAHTPQVPPDLGASHGGPTIGGPRPNGRLSLRFEAVSARRFGSARPKWVATKWEPA
eukprot:15290008-Alexandrium_andersonii.AAC.1